MKYFRISQKLCVKNSNWWTEQERSSGSIVWTEISEFLLGEHEEDPSKRHSVHSQLLVLDKKNKPNQTLWDELFVLRTSAQCEAATKDSAFTETSRTGFQLV